MKIFLIFFLTTMTVTAAPKVRESDKIILQNVILEEIIESTKDLKDILKAKLFVQKVITNEDCTHSNFCKAGKILGKYKAEELGLKQKEWLLPRKLVAYTRDLNCKDPGSDVRVQLHQLLDNIHHCAQKEFSKSYEL